ncbi:MAG TPA: serpin family protein, partial [Micromonosporaceae bacterium]|nr:serpin family protein [Micromonosporaceae bacterium]
MTLRAEGVSRLAPSPEAPVRELARSIAALGHELGTVSAEPGQNWVVSPASIAMAFAMARAGAAGETAAQIDRVFGFPANGLHEAFNSMGQQAVTADVPPKAKAEPTRQAGVVQPPPVVCVGNA